MVRGVADHSVPTEDGSEMPEQHARPSLPQVLRPARPSVRPSLEQLRERRRSRSASGVGIASLGIHDDFFDLGGHSLQAAQVVITLRSAFQIDMALRHLFERPTIAGLAEIIDVLAVSAGDGGRQRDDARGDRVEIEV